MSIFEIKFSVYMQASKQTTNQPTKQMPYREDKLLCSAAGMTKKVNCSDGINGRFRFVINITKYDHRKIENMYKIFTIVYKWFIYSKKIYCWYVPNFYLDVFLSRCLTCRLKM